MAQAKVTGSDILVIDELGPLEMSGKGWSDLIGKILQEYPRPMIWTVRRSLAEKMAVRWNVGKVDIIFLKEKAMLATL